MQASDYVLMGWVAGGAIVVFAIIILIGVIMRAVKAPPGQRMREAFGPFAGAGEKYQELHTGQEGLRDSMMRTIQEQSQQGGERDADGDRDPAAGRGAGDGENAGAGVDESAHDGENRAADASGEAGEPPAEPKS